MNSGAKMPSGPDGKSVWWRAASVMVGYVGIIELLSLVFGGLPWLGSWWVFPVLLFAGLASLEFGLPWLRGRAPRPKDAYDWPIARTDIPEPKAGSAYVLVQTHPPGGRTPKLETVGPGWYVAHILFWKAPLHLGDAILSLVYQWLGVALGRRSERQISGSLSDLDRTDPPGPSSF